MSARRAASPRARDVLGLCLVLLVLFSVGGCRSQDEPLAIPTRPVPVNVAAGDELVRRWQGALTAVTSSVELLATESELTALAAANLAGTPLDRVAVWVEPQGVIVLAHGRLGKPRVLRASCQLVTRAGSPRCEQLRAILDGRALPRLVLRSLEQAINDALADADLPVIVERVESREGYLRIVVEPD